jgi:imidazolonepropionase
MTVTALTGIAQLVTNDPTHEYAEAASGPLGVILDAAVVMDGGRVRWTGPATRLPGGADRVVDLGGRAVVPGFVDSHNHLAFAGDRSEEFAARMTGESYSAGGIRSTVAHTRAASDDALARSVRRLADEALRQGTTTIESKSGYGLSVDDERRSLAAVRTVTTESTFLGAHVVPAEFAGRADDYVALVIGEMLDACAPLAKWIDVFCDVGAFDVDQTRAILTAGMAAGLTPRLHAGQLAPGGGIQLAVELGAASADPVTTWRRWPGPQRSRPSFPGPSSRRGPSTPTPGGCSRPGRRWPWRPTATRDRATRRACRSASRWRCATCG